MQIGYIGLGKMGKNMVLRLLEKGHEVVVWNRSIEPREEVAKAGAVAVESVEQMLSKLSGQKVVWLMLPAGDVTHEMIMLLSEKLSPGDVMIDGANNYYKNTIQHGEVLAQKQILFLDAGVSGGPAGARNGACVMVGGDQDAFTTLEPLRINFFQELERGILQKWCITVLSTA
jgi:6-phosphogluconate dehydrogenase